MIRQGSNFHRYKSHLHYSYQIGICIKTDLYFDYKPITYYLCALCSNNKITSRIPVCLYTQGNFTFYSTQSYGYSYFIVLIYDFTENKQYRNIHYDNHYIR